MRFLLVLSIVITLARCVQSPDDDGIYVDCPVDTTADSTFYSPGGKCFVLD